MSDMVELATNLGISPECYVIRGNHSNGGPFVSRLFVAEGHYRTIKDAGLNARFRASQINTAGGSVVAVKQRINPQSGLWEDVDG